MSIFIGSPKTEKEYLEYFHFRWRMLRQPYGGEPGTEKDNLEDKSFHIMLTEFGKIIGVGRIHFEEKGDSKKGQIRYMAINQLYQKKGYGTKILQALEAYAAKDKANNIFLNSRSAAIEFYKKNGYKTIKKTHLLFDEIQHWLMVKKIVKR